MSIAKKFMLIVSFLYPPNNISIFRYFYNLKRLFYFDCFQISLNKLRLLHFGRFRYSLSLHVLAILKKRVGANVSHIDKKCLALLIIHLHRSVGTALRISIFNSLSLFYNNVISFVI
jgi:hypothetical protein